MAIVDETYYNSTFMGLSVVTADFPQLEAWAERSISLITRGRVTESNLSTLHARVQAGYKNAVCAQISYYSENGLSVALEGRSDSSFTVGKVSVSSGSKGAAEAICPLAMSYLEQTGLLNPRIGTADWGWG